MGIGGGVAHGSESGGGGWRQRWQEEECDAEGDVASRPSRQEQLFFLHCGRDVQGSKTASLRNNDTTFSPGKRNEIIAGDGNGSSLASHPCNAPSTPYYRVVVVVVVVSTLRVTCRDLDAIPDGGNRV